MARRFRFRLLRGTVFELDYARRKQTQHGPGFEMELTEEEAAHLYRRRGQRDYELLEVIYENEAQPPSRKLPG